MRYLRILPAIVANTPWPFSSVTRNIALGSTSFTTPSNSIMSSFMQPPAYGANLAARTDDVLGGGTLLALHDVELHRLTFGQRLEAVALDGRMMHEAILLAVRRGDEPETLRIVEPLHSTGRTHR
eukprot:TRINITY_DN6691_c0_g1_i1.p1 TRINITY_DN6691_c0_g1~~TRINITY_DN6691_c0_g1_i1.p1  ORF type:complete len:125 (-),score=10.58 TRINITY_DN6691_c0_g1_i1:204-578(-)